MESTSPIDLQVLRTPLKPKGNTSNVNITYTPLSRASKSDALALMDDSQSQTGTADWVPPTPTSTRKTRPALNPTRGSDSPVLLGPPTTRSSGGWAFGLPQTPARPLSRSRGLRVPTVDDGAAWTPMTPQSRHRPAQGFSVSFNENARGGAGDGDGAAVFGGLGLGAAAAAEERILEFTEADFYSDTSDAEGEPDSPSPFVLSSLPPFPNVNADADAADNAGATSELQLANLNNVLDEVDAFFTSDFGTASSVPPRGTIDTNMNATTEAVFDAFFDNNNDPADPTSAQGLSLVGGDMTSAWMVPILSTSTPRMVGPLLPLVDAEREFSALGSNNNTDVEMPDPVTTDADVDNPFWAPLTTPTILLPASASSCSALKSDSLPTLTSDADAGAVGNGMGSADAWTRMPTGSSAPAWAYKYRSVEEYVQDYEADGPHPTLDELAALPSVVDFTSDASTTGGGVDTGSTADAWIPSLAPAPEPQPAWTYLTVEEYVQDYEGDGPHPTLEELAALPHAADLQSEANAARGQPTLDPLPSAFSSVAMGGVDFHALERTLPALNPELQAAMNAVRGMGIGDGARAPAPIFAPPAGIAEMPGGGAPRVRTFDECVVDVHAGGALPSIQELLSMDLAQLKAILPAIYPPLPNLENFEFSFSMPVKGWKGMAYVGETMRATGDGDGGMVACAGQGDDKAGGKKRTFSEMVGEDEEAGASSSSFSVASSSSIASSSSVITASSLPSITASPPIQDATSASRSPGEGTGTDAHRDKRARLGDRPLDIHCPKPVRPQPWWVRGY